MIAGISIIPYADELPRIRELGGAADTGGLGLVAIQDHPYQHHFLDAFALIATLMAETRRIGFVTDVANLPLRPPAVLARTAASLDAIGGGRFELGLGGGAFAAGIAGLGAERRSPGETVDAVEEGIDVIRLMWSDKRSVSFAGRHYLLDDARPGPPAAQPIGIWLGAFRRRMLRLAGRKADGWLPSLGPLTPQELREGNKIVDGAAEAAGRDPHDVRRILNLQGVIGEHRSAGGGERLPVGYLSGEPLAGPPEWWAVTLAGFGDDGFDTLIFMPIERTTDQVERFAREVV